MLRYLCELGALPRARRRAAIARHVARAFGRKSPPRLTPGPVLEVLAARRLGLVRGTPEADAVQARVARFARGRERPAPTPSQRELGSRRLGLIRDRRAS